MGNMVQANSISGGFATAFDVPSWAVGLVLAAICSFVFIGGIKAIARVAEKIVPAMAILYILVGLAIIAFNLNQIPHIIYLIINSAFNPLAAWGGAAGVGIATAMRYGVARGLFSNEAGMGSTPHAHAAAIVRHPVEQGELGIMSVFVDTFIVLNITVFVVLSSGVIDLESGKTAFSGIALVQEAFSTHIFGHSSGYVFIAVCLFFFAFTTIVGWYYFAEINVRYLLGARWIRALQVGVVACIFLGSTQKVELVWELADLFNGFMVVPNLIAILILSPVVVRLLKDYSANKPYNAKDYIKG